MKEAASLKKYDLVTDSRDLLSQSSQSSLSSPPISAPNSPAVSLASPIKTSTEPQPPSPLSGEGLPSTPEKEEQQGKVNGELRNKMDEAPEAGGPVQTHQSQTQDIAAQLTVVQEEVPSVNTQPAELAAEPQVQNTDAAIDTESLPDVGNTKTEVVAAQENDAGPAEGAASQTETHRASWDIKPEAPSSAQTPADLKHEEAASVSDANSLDVSAGSELPTSDLERTEDVQTAQSSEEEGSTTLSKSPVSSDDPAEDRTSDTLAARAEAASNDIEETPSDPEAPPPDSIKEIRNLVVEVIEVEELVQCYPDGVPKEE